ncbi:MAG: hypothetical protein QF814_08020, partial [Candidatus Marinimicrobia bacterium]|nr:hypothetical protein [Candidatus Neomarinimicrobiota bacterium]
MATIYMNRGIWYITASYDKQRLIRRNTLPFVENVNRYFSVRYNLISKNKEPNTSILKIHYIGKASNIF